VSLLEAAAQIVVFSDCLVLLTSFKHGLQHAFD